LFWFIKTLPTLQRKSAARAVSPSVSNVIANPIEKFFVASSCLPCLSKKVAKGFVAQRDTAPLAGRLAENLERGRAHRQRLIQPSEILKHRRQVDAHARHFDVVVAKQTLHDLQSGLVVRHCRIVLGHRICHDAKQSQCTRFVHAALGRQKQSTLRELLRQLKRFRVAQTLRRVT
jgi:hypothetical protein